MIFKFKTSSYLLIVLILSFGCANTRYLSDADSIQRQLQMKQHRNQIATSRVFANVGSAILSGILNTDITIDVNKHNFRKLKLINESSDTIYVNMVTDILWKEKEYCDIVGIVLPGKKKQTVLIPYMAAYNIYFRSSETEEEKFELSEESSKTRIKLRPGMTIFTEIEK